MIEKRINQECKFFKGYEPCIYNKMYGEVCQCKFYFKVRKKLLIIKTGNLKEILRLTSILPILKNHYKDYVFYWLTSKNGVDILRTNQYIDKIYVYELSYIEMIKREDFDIVFNFDISPQVSALAESLNSMFKYGYTFDKQFGVVKPVNKLANIDYYINIDINERRKNTLSQPEIFAKMIGLPEKPEGYILPKINKSKFKLLEVCLNWIPDYMTQEWLYWKDLEFMLMNKKISYSLQEKNFKFQDYYNWLNSGKVIVSISNLGMDLGIGLGKYVISILGCEDINIDLYGKGIKLYDKNLECLNSGKRYCDNLSCLRNIKPEMVLAEIEKAL